MLLVDHATQPRVRSLSGQLAIRQVANAALGASQQSVWRLDHAPGEVVPLHWQDCEEVITVLEGEGEATIGDETVRIGPDMSLLVPPRTWHGYRCHGPGYLRLVAVLSDPAPAVHREPLPE